MAGKEKGDPASPAADDAGGSVQESDVKRTRVLKDKEWIESIDDQERSYFDDNRVAKEVLEDLEVKCTACFNQVNHKARGLIARHPILGVVTCKACRNFFFEGTWTRDEDGFFEHCRWCGNGGDLVCCAIETCKNSFCSICIKRNLGRTAVSNAQESEEWKCLSCDLSQVRELRLLFYSIYQYWTDEKHKEETREAKRKALQESKTDDVGQLLEEATSVQKIFKEFVNDHKRTWQKKREKAKTEGPEELQKASVEAAQGLKKFVVLMKRNLDKFDQNISAKFPEAELINSQDLEFSSAEEGHSHDLLESKKKGF